MNKRIRKKRLAEFDRGILDGLRLFVSRPAGREYDELATDMLSLNIGMALAIRHDVVPGPRRGWRIRPLTRVEVLEETRDVVLVRATVEYLPPGNNSPVVEQLLFSARRDADRTWRHVTVSASISHSQE